MHNSRSTMQSMMQQMLAERLCAVHCCIGLIAASAVGLAYVSPASAHHSFAMFDTAKTNSIVGTVKEFQWQNPHIWVEMEAKEGSREVHYSIEGASVNILVRAGWTRSSLKPGDKITMFFHPLKSAAIGGSLVKVVFSDGRELVVER